MTGCGPVEKVKLWPVSGSVKVAGKPLTTGWITFHPDEARGNKSSRLPVAEIQPDGTYVLSTNRKPGALAGFYKIVVAASLEPIPLKPPRNPDGTPRKLRWLVHEKYTQPASTDLLIEVVERPAPGRYDLELDGN
jgi:hypothetical protein